jgi:SAM-dependent methyltransferase
VAGGLPGPRGTALTGTGAPHGSAGRDDTGHMTEQAHDAGEVFGAEFWDERYRSAQRVWSGNPNPQLVAEVARRPPGRALDVGCGEGADAIWLARRGWAVVAVDFSGVALERAARHARDTDPAAAGRIEWRQADLLVTEPEPRGFDLVSAQFMHFPPEPRTRLFTALAAAVRDGGMLLVVGHHPSDLATGVPRPPTPERFYTPEEIAGLLDGSWTISACEARPRSGNTREGAIVTIHDTVLSAVRRPAANPPH